MGCFQWKSHSCCGMRVANEQVLSGGLGGSPGLGLAVEGPLLLPAPGLCSGRGWVRTAPRGPGDAPQRTGSRRKAKTSIFISIDRLVMGICPFPVGINTLGCAMFNERLFSRALERAMCSFLPESGRGAGWASPPSPALGWDAARLLAGARTRGDRVALSTEPVCQRPGLQRLWRDGLPVGGPSAGSASFVTESISHGLIFPNRGYNWPHPTYNKEHVPSEPKRFTPNKKGNPIGEGGKADAGRIQ